VNALPRARLVANVRWSSNLVRDLAGIAVEETALLSGQVAAFEGPAGSAIVVTDAPGRLVVDVTAPRRNLLVTTETYHRGWHAADDKGRPLQVVRAYGDYLATVVEPGTRRVVLAFEPASTRIGAWISAAGLLLTLGIGLVLTRTPRSW
jgi:hypothetical protein